MTDATPHHATFSQYTKAIETRDRPGLLDLFAEDAVQIDPYPSAPNVGRDAIGAFFDQTWQMTEAMEFIVGKAIVSEDRGVFPFTVRSTVGGGQVEVDAIDVVRFAADGRIAELTAFVDYAGMRSL